MPALWKGVEFMAEKKANSVIQGLDRIFDHTVNIAAVMAGIIVVLQTVAIAGNTILSFVFNKWITGVESMTEFGILYITFLSAAWILKQDRHVTVDILTVKMTRLTQNIVNLIISIICIGLCLMLTVFGTYVTYDHWIRRISDYNKLSDFPIAIPLAVIPIGCLLLSVQFVKKSCGHAKNIKNEISSRK